MKYLHNTKSDNKVLTLLDTNTLLDSTIKIKCEIFKDRIQTFIPVAQGTPLGNEKLLIAFPH